MSDRPEPTVGQLFEDRDPRMGRRLVKVVGKSPVEGKYVVRSFISASYPLGRRSTVSLENLYRRFRPYES